MRRATVPRLLGLATVTIALAAAGCSSGGTGGSPGGTTSGGTSSTLVIANAVRVDTLDPEANSVNESIWMDQNLYSRLLQPNPTGTGLVPDLATSWKISQNGLVYTFHLRSAKFSDGTPVTASDVAYSIQRSRAFKGGWGFLLTPVKTITAPDPHTVVIKLSSARAVAGRPGHVRVLGRAEEGGAGPGQGVLPAPGRQRAVLRRPPTSRTARSTWPAIRTSTARSRRSARSAT